MIEEISQLQRQELSIKTRCISAADLDDDEVKFRLDFKFNEQLHEYVISLPVKYDSLVTSKSSLDDL